MHYHPEKHPVVIGWRDRSPAPTPCYSDRSYSPSRLTAYFGDSASERSDAGGVVTPLLECLPSHRLPPAILFRQSVRLTPKLNCKAICYPSGSPICGSERCPATQPQWLPS